MSKQGNPTSRRTVLKTLTGTAVAASGFAARAPAQVGRHTVTIWSHFAGTNYEVLKRFVSEFNTANPDIEVKTTLFRGFGNPAKISRPLCCSGSRTRYFFTHRATCRPTSPATR